MSRLLLVFLLCPALSFAQKGKVYVTVDGSYGTYRIHSTDISAGYIKKGFHFGIGAGIQVTPIPYNETYNYTTVPLFVEAGFMKAKLPFLTVRRGKHIIQNSSRKGYSYTNARIGMPIRLAQDYYVSPFLFTTSWKLEFKSNTLYAWIPLRYYGFGLMLSKM